MHFPWVTILPLQHSRYFAYTSRQRKITECRGTQQLWLHLSSGDGVYVYLLSFVSNCLITKWCSFFFWIFQVRKEYQRFFRSHATAVIQRCWLSYLVSNPIYLHEVICYEQFMQFIGITIAWSLLEGYISIAIRNFVPKYAK